jgi:hypothetical protein
MDVERQHRDQQRTVTITPAAMVICRAGYRTGGAGELLVATVAVCRGVEFSRC